MNEENTALAGEGVDFDFGFDNFRPMGFTYRGVITSAKIEKPKNATFTFIDKRSGKEVTKEAKPQLVVLIQPTDHATRSGNPYPEYLALTHNSRSKLGVFIQHLADLGIKLGNDPAKIEGMEFDFEVKEIDFGGAEPTRVTCPVAIVDALSGESTKASTASTVARNSDPFADLPLADIVHTLDGVAPDDAVITVSRSIRDPRVIGGMASGELVTYLKDKGMIGEANGTYRALAEVA